MREKELYNGGRRHFNKPFEIVSQLRFQFGVTEAALLVTQSEHFAYRFALFEHHSALSGCDSPAVVVEYSYDSLAVVVGYSLLGCDSRGFWTAAVEPVTVCSRHIRHLQPQLWHPPATPSLAGWSVALSSCSSGTAGSSGPGDAPPGIASSLPACSCHDAPILIDPLFYHCRPRKQLPEVLETFGRE